MTGTHLTRLSEIRFTDSFELCEPDIRRLIAHLGDDFPRNLRLQMVSIVEPFFKLLFAWYLFGATDLRVAELRAELDANLALRQRIVAGMEQAIAAKKDRLKRLWTCASNIQNQNL